MKPDAKPPMSTPAPQTPAWTPWPWSTRDTSIVSERYCIAVIEDDGGYEAPPEQRKANAALIAAAPALYEALKAAEEWFNQYEESLGDKHSAHVSGPITAAIAAAQRPEEGA